jgi:hypothetical protein
MSTCTLPYPCQLRDQLKDELPDIRGRGSVKVTPRDRDGRRCAAWDAEFYEVAAYYVATGTSLDRLEAALRARIGTVRTTQITGNPAQIRDADWPGFARRRDRQSLRLQVLAMIADMPATETS